MGSLTVMLFPACGVELTQGNSEPFIVAVGPISYFPPDALSLEYTVADFQQDDAVVNISLCTSPDNKCYVAVAAPSSPGTSRISTVSAVPNNYSASHLFIWQPECGLLDPQSNKYTSLDLNTEFFFKVSVSTNDHGPIKSKPKTLTKLGFSKPLSTTCP